MKKGLWIVLGVVCLLGLIFGSWAWRYYTAPIKGRVTAQEQIQSGQNRIQKYNKFYDMCARAQSLTDKLDAQQEQLENTKEEDRKSRIRTRIAGLKGEFSRVVRQYNADARKSYTAGQFRSSDLPYQLSTDYEEEIVCENY